MKRKGINYRQQLLKNIKGKVAVYIDAANLEQSVKDLGLPLPSALPKRKVYKLSDRYWRVDYRKIYNFFVKNTQLASISFYTARFATHSHDNFLAFLKKKGYRLVTKRIKKNSPQRKCSCPEMSVLSKGE